MSGSRGLCRSGGRRLLDSCLVLRLLPKTVGPGIGEGPLTAVPTQSLDRSPLRLVLDHC